MQKWRKRRTAKRKEWAAGFNFSILFVVTVDIRRHLFIVVIRFTITASVTAGISSFFILRFYRRRKKGNMKKRHQMKVHIQRFNYNTTGKSKRQREKCKREDIVQKLNLFPCWHTFFTCLRLRCDAKKKREKHRPWYKPYQNTHLLRIERIAEVGTLC